MGLFTRKKKEKAPAKLEQPTSGTEKTQDYWDKLAAKEQTTPRPRMDGTLTPNQPLRFNASHPRGVARPAPQPRPYTPSQPATFTPPARPQPEVQKAETAISRQKGTPNGNLGQLLVARFPVLGRRITIVISVFLAISLIIAGIVLIVLNKPLPSYVDKNLPAEDQQRQIDLHEIGVAVYKYYKENSQQYPLLLQVRIDGQNDPLSQILVPIFIKEMPMDENDAVYTYSSLTGKSFLLRVELSNGEYYDVTEDDFITPANKADYL